MSWLADYFSLGRLWHLVVSAPAQFPTGEVFADAAPLLEEECGFVLRQARKISRIHCNFISRAPGPDSPPT